MQNVLLQREEQEIERTGSGPSSEGAWKQIKDIHFSIRSFNFYQIHVTNMGGKKKAPTISTELFNGTYSCSLSVKCRSNLSWKSASLNASSTYKRKAELSQCHKSHKAQMQRNYIHFPWQSKCKEIQQKKKNKKQQPKTNPDELCK